MVVSLKQLETVKLISAELSVKTAVSCWPYVF